MNRNPLALITLIRNRLNNDYDENIKWFQDKNIVLNREGNLFHLKRAENVDDSELSIVCNGILFKGARLVAWPGFITRECSLEEAKSLSGFVWNDETYFVEVIDGIEIYMWWDWDVNKWGFSGPNKIRSPYQKRLVEKLYNVMSGDPAFTYVFKMTEKGKVYLDRMYDTKKLKEMEWDLTYKYAVKFKVEHPTLYKFEGLDKIEASDLPIIARDVRSSRILIR